MNVLDILKYGDRTFKSAYGKVSDEHWEVGEVCGVWSAKNIVAHLTSSELILADVMSRFIDDKAPTPQLDVLRTPGYNFNDGEVDKRKELTPTETVAEYNAAHAKVLELAPQITPELYRKNGTMPWYGDDYCLDDLVVYINYAHKREHAAEINAYLDRVS